MGMKLIVVYDIFDQPRAGKCISDLLPDVVKIQYLSLNALLGWPHLLGTSTHEHLFKHGGIETVIQALVEYSDPETIAIGYSAGGTALWRAVQAGMSLQGLFCVSSTRLRELGPIEPHTHTYFGSKDSNRPNDNWLSQASPNHTILQDVGHNFYQRTFSRLGALYCQKIADDIACFHTQYP